ncbi:MAG: MotA/TolQ/ExbB proton channel family protein [Proteobacteria bacterium]|nr:MotA/TolQ/ExbB proton channel family protein [Pseudomonadota bacterium]MBU1388890.1 MotA/TolQ/ExbB proton channel family protein [Pseudomonadota bacterium]MBU1543442.1 MotA/TolQ/ExbB proton channel family protein [Pseudomonadota bacterium]MBU2431210.1 MotA/TolQ/ExbB proton channel family protein [Pseudomonadota bacterium]MBU2480845.1 MotA/TolQ/ExbB proton channel family protein [Pseudomonadota bacterium]
MLTSESLLFLKQTRKNIIGLMICIVLFFSGFFIHGNSGLYINLSGFLIVIGGTLGATFLSYNMKRIEILFKVLKTSYGKQTRRPVEVVQMLVDLSIRRRIKGVLSLQEDEDKTDVAFLKQAIGLLVDGCSKEQIKDSLSAEMYFFRMRRDETRRLLQTMADVAPSFGLVGSVVGLIGMLSGAGNSAVVMATIPIALTSTLYGIVLANFIFLPFAATIRERTVKELFLQKLISDGILAIYDELHPRMLERKLKAFLTPSEREGLVVSFESIQEKIELAEIHESAKA